MYDPAAALRVPMPVPGVNPVRTRADWETMRAAVLADPGAFHGDIAARNLHWLVTVGGNAAWLSRDEQGRWAGWDASTAAPVTADLPADFAPWARAFNADDAPNFRWFEGGRTNAAFNELDRHVLAGHGLETAFIFEGDRWDLAADNGRGGLHRLPRHWTAGLHFKTEICLIQSLSFHQLAVHTDCLGH